MKTIIVIILTGIISLQAYGQDIDKKSMLLISTKYYNDKCDYVAFRVSNLKIEIDNCYNINSKIFNSIKTIDLLDDSFIRKIYRTSTQDLKNYEMEINATNCDYIAPISVIISEGGKETKIEWKGVSNCYPKSMRFMIEGLMKRFEKYK